MEPNSIQADRIEKNKHYSLYRLATRWEFPIVLGISFLITLTIGRRIFSPGYVFLAEEFEVYSIPNFVKVFYPTWDNLFQRFDWASFYKMYLYAPFALFSSIFNSYKVLQILLLLSPYSIAFSSMYYLLKYLLSSDNSYKRNSYFLILLLSSFIYVVNPWLASHPRNLFLRFHYALLPLSTLFFLKMIKEKDFKYSVLFALTLNLWGFRPIILSSFFFLIIYVFALASIKSKRKTLRLSIVTVLLFSLIFLGRTLPILFAAIKNPSFFSGYSSIVRSSQTLTSLLRVFNLRGYFPGCAAENWNAPYDAVYCNLFIPITALSFSYLLFKQKIRGKSRPFYKFCFPVIFCFYSFFSVVKLPSFLMNNIFGQIILRAFRTSSQTSMYLCLPLSVMLAYSLVKIYCLKKDRKKATVISLFLAIIVLSSISSWPMLTGNMNGYWTPSQVPEDYIKVNDYLSQNNNSHVLWVPSFFGESAVWSNASKPFGSVPFGKFAIRSSSMPSYDYSLFYFFDYYNPVQSWESNPIKGYSGSELPKIYTNLNLEYLAIHSDILHPWMKNKERLVSATTAKICNTTQAFVIYKGRFITLIKLGEGNEFKICKPVVIEGGLRTEASIAFLNASGYATLYLDQNLKETESYMDFADVFVIGRPDIALPVLKKDVILDFSDINYNTDAGEGWVKDSVSSFNFQDSLDAMSLGNWSWDFDYGKGLVFTYALPPIPENAKAKESDLVSLWNFENEESFQAWVNETRPTIQKLEVRNNSLKAELYNSTWSWKTIRSPLIDASPGNQYRFMFNVKGENASNVHAKVLEYDANRTSIPSVLEVIKEKRIGDGTFGWKTIRFDYTPTNELAKYIQLQIWHGHNTTKPLPNVVRLSNVRLYNMSKYAKSITVNRSFEVEKEDDYELFVRYFENQKGGTIRVYLDGNPISITTKDQLNKFVWKNLGTQHLMEGEHEIVLENCWGFNAVNFLSVIPEKEYMELKGEVEKTLQNKTVISIMEAESDMYHNYTDISNEYGGEASNGQVLILNQNSTIWQNITIAKTDHYQLKMRGKGEIQIQLDNQTYKIDSPNLRWSDLNKTFPILKGTHRIEITTPTNAEVDVVWLYSTQGENETLADILSTKQENAEIISYKKIDSTKYTVNINATRSFMLSFAEAYDPLWTAHVNGENIGSIPLYSVVNGFWINQTGQLEITIEYEPQKWFYYGSIISITTFLTCLTFLIYNWIKNRNQPKWGMAHL